MTPEAERELLIEQVVAAWRPEGGDRGMRAHPAWHDLDERGRTEAARRTLQARRMEAALDSEGLSTTARLVLAKIRRDSPPENPGIL